MTDDLDPVNLARRLIAIDSVNPDLVPGAAGEGAIADFCAGWLRDRGFAVTRLEARPGRPSVVGVLPGRAGGRSLMLNGHLDTVGVQGYDGDPFAGDVRDGKLFGRGAFDMKGSLAAILVAAARAAATGTAGDVLVTLVADEEFGSIGTEEVLRKFTADGAIVCEPSEMEVTLAHRGFAWFEVDFAGKAAHGSMPQKGIDAIAHAAKFLQAVDGLRARLEAERPHPILGRGAVRVSMIRGGVDAATVAPDCRVTVERRTLPGQTPDATEQELRGLLDGLAASTPGLSYTLKRLAARGAFAADPAHPIVAALTANARRVLGRAPAVRGEPFWTDAGLIAEAGIPCLLMGVDGGGAHAATEWATVESIVRLTDILEGTIRDFCSERGSTASGPPGTVPKNPRSSAG